MRLLQSFTCNQRSTQERGSNRFLLKRIGFVGMYGAISTNPACEFEKLPPKEHCRLRLYSTSSN